MTGSKQYLKRNIFSAGLNFSPGKLKKLREDLGLTQEDVAQKIHICKDTISNIESGRCPSPQFNTLFKLVELYNVPICFITKNQTLKHDINRLIEQKLKINPEKFFDILKSNKVIDLKRQRFLQFGLKVEDKIIEEIFDIHEKSIAIS